ncbi:MAG: bifunctional 5,10-methylenetetrahydrofolate dehydrogenase/5,10-methenyltetrahydrofolate cyclohydrolase [Candidatus Pacebacteria bacterium]|nr:bifunctional 5,10-methylenetetrahydrofolate dehydrogenase/5,10-methenyltetrahydrofolate cyclohydrolase [Candidatus Paceibacterota bacterium]
MKILNGKKEAEKIYSNLKRVIKDEPSLAVILVGDDKSSKLYIKKKKKAAKEIGIKVSQYVFPSNSKDAEVIETINKLNRDSSVNGIIVQLPLPVGFNTNKIVGSVSKQKDVDGFTKGKLVFDPPLPAAILFALNKIGGKRKTIVALANSDIFGKTLKDFLERKEIKIDYMLRKDFSLDRIKKADVVISVCGCPGFLKGDMFKKGVALIDAGMKISKGKVAGDVEKGSVKQKASFLTPVPGGLGPLNVALLLKNVYLAWKLQN